MPKILIITLVEIRAFVQTKAFLMSVLLLPILMVGGSLANHRLTGVDARPKSFAIIDHTGVLFPAIELAAQERDREIDGGNSRSGSIHFKPFLVTVNGNLDVERLRLSEEVKAERYLAIAEIPADLIDAKDSRVIYVSNSPTSLVVREWMDFVLAKEVRMRRYMAAGLGPDVVKTSERGVYSESRGLWERSTDGKAQQASTVGKGELLVAMLVPLAGAFLLFMLVMISTPYLLQAVIEEKSSRISEVLLGSVTPFQLMMGKLLGSVTVSLGLGAVYLFGIVRAAAQMGHGNIVSTSMVVYFMIYLALAMLLYGAIYLAVGAACSELKEAQSLLMPVVFLFIVPPFFVVRPIIESPGSTFATVMSLVPTASPFLMLLRVGLQPGPPAWQIAASMLSTLVTAVFCVWAAGRIFRIGLLMQGRAPSFAQMARWVFTR
jgi:ABC-2 type transport system permease protein